MLGTVLSLAPGGFAYTACVKCRSKMTSTTGNCGRCRGPQMSDLRFALRLSVMLKPAHTNAPKQKHPAPINLTLFGDTVAWLFGGTPASFMAKIANLQAPIHETTARTTSMVPPSAAAAAAGTIDDPLIFVALQQCLVGEQFLFSDIRDTTPRGSTGPRSYTAEKVTPLLAGRFETVPAVYAAILYHRPSPSVPMVSNSEMDWASQSFIAAAAADSPQACVLSPAAAPAASPMAALRMQPPPPPPWSTVFGSEPAAPSLAIIAQRDLAWASLDDDPPFASTAISAVEPCSAATSPAHDAVAATQTSATSIVASVSSGGGGTPPSPLALQETRARPKRKRDTGSSPEPAPLSTPRLFTPYSLRRRPLRVVNGGSTALAAVAKSVSPTVVSDDTVPSCASTGEAQLTHTASAPRMRTLSTVTQGRRVLRREISDHRSFASFKRAGDQLASLPLCESPAGIDDAHADKTPANRRPSKFAALPLKRK